MRWEKRKSRNIDKDRYVAEAIFLDHRDLKPFPKPVPSSSFFH